MSGEKVCDCDYWHSKHRWHCSTNYPTPVPSEVAETTAGEREVEALAYLFGEHASIGSDERKIGDEWVWGFDCECGEFTPDTEVNEHLARAVLASPALAALLDRVRREEGANADALSEPCPYCWSPHPHRCRTGCAGSVE